ncbi:hypothetical protein [Halapricum salinum]|uniref:hypothetical protein n=1 Tax=Halapricum salinum TaxID=1457250 RepID=UPI0010A52DB4|nr:hypothetical protein [Halapricum salinum]
MSEDNYNRRKTLKLLGSTGLGLFVSSIGTTGAAEARPGKSEEAPIVKRNGKAFVRSRAPSIPLSRRNLQTIRAKYFDEFVEESDLNNDGIALSLPKQKPIRAYNLGVDDGIIKEFIGYDIPASRQGRDNGRRSRELTTNKQQIEDTFNEADKHLDRIGSRDSGSDRLQTQSEYSIGTSSTGDFNDWNKITETIETNTVEDYGKFFTKVDCYRYHESDTENDAYGIVSFSEMGGGALDGVDDSIRNTELVLEHEWDDNADMKHESRYPRSDVTGQVSETWSAGISISWPPGINVSTSNTYTQHDVQTYDESDPWEDLGKWRVSIGSNHTQKYTASVNPGSLADVDRTVQKSSWFGSYQPVGRVHSKATWYELEGMDFNRYIDSHFIDLMDQVKFTI